MMKNKFQVGDRVTVKNKLLYTSNMVKPGLEGTVCSNSHAYHYVGVAFDDYCNGHVCGGTCKDGYGWYIYTSDLVNLGNIDALENIEFSDIEFNNMVMAGGV